MSHLEDVSIFIRQFLQGEKDQSTKALNKLLDRLRNASGPAKREVADRLLEILASPNLPPKVKNTLIEVLWVKVMVHTRRQVNLEEDAEDITQTVFSHPEEKCLEFIRRVLKGGEPEKGKHENRKLKNTTLKERKQKKLKNAHNLTGYFNEGADKRVIDFYRKRNAQEKHLGERLELDHPDVHSAWPGNFLRPDDDLQRWRLAKILTDGLEELRKQMPSDWDIFVSHHIKERPIKEIAEARALTVRRVKYQCERAARFLQNWLQVSHSITETSVSYLCGAPLGGQRVWGQGDLGIHYV